MVTSRKRLGWRAGAVLVGVVLSLTPAVLFAYNMDSGKSAGNPAVVAAISEDGGVLGGKSVFQASPTARPASPTATAGAAGAGPAAPRTGTAGLAADGGTAAVAVGVLLALTVGVVAGGRVLSLRNRA